MYTRTTSSKKATTCARVIYVQRHTCAMPSVIGFEYSKVSFPLVLIHVVFSHYLFLYFARSYIFSPKFQA
jgi:hypothetical protein